MKKNRAWLVTGTLTFLLFLGLAALIRTQSLLLHNFDSGIQHLILPTTNSTHTLIFSTITFFGSPLANLILTILIAGGLWISRQHLIAIWVVFVQLGGDAIATFIKLFVHRVRPQFQLVHNAGFSFPSGHTLTTALLLLTVLFVLIPFVDDAEMQLIVTLLSFIWFGIIAFSRIYLRAHWPSDILGSVFLSFSWWEVSRILYFYFLKIQVRFPKLTLHNERHDLN